MYFFHLVPSLLQSAFFARVILRSLRLVVFDRPKVLGSAKADCLEKSERSVV